MAGIGLPADRDASDRSDTDFSVISYAKKLSLEIYENEVPYVTHVIRLVPTNVCA